MKRLLLAVILLAGTTNAVWARTVEQQLVASLVKQGYVVLEQGYTFLGRLRIVAENGKIHREIVVNPGTGEILRDYAVTLKSHPAPQDLPEIPGAGTTGVASAPAPNPGSDGEPTATAAGVAGDVPDDGTVLDTSTTSPDIEVIAPPEITTQGEEGAPVVEVPDALLPMIPAEP